MNFKEHSTILFYARIDICSVARIPLKVLQFLAAELVIHVQETASLENVFIYT